FVPLRCSSSSDHAPLRSAFFTWQNSTELGASEESRMATSSLNSERMAKSCCVSSLSTADSVAHHCWNGKPSVADLPPDSSPGKSRNSASRGPGADAADPGDFRRGGIVRFGCLQLLLDSNRPPTREISCLCCLHLRRTF